MHQQHSRIFILSHMRAYTSLLAHILGSHPAIAGYYEMHLSYASEEDLSRQVQHYTQHESIKPGSRFLLDKLLHNDYALDLQRLHLQGEKILLTLRAPEPTIASIVRLFAKKNTNDPYAGPAEATKYYNERLHRLAAFAQDYPKHYYYLDAELIRTDTQRTLETLQAWLQLDAPLSPQYQTFAKTGVPGAGDTSPAITYGRIIREATRYAMLPATDSLRQAIDGYCQCRHLLIRNAIAALTAQSSDPRLPAP